MALTQAAPEQTSLPREGESPGFLAGLSLGPETDLQTLRLEKSDSGDSETVVKSRA